MRHAIAALTILAAPASADAAELIVYSPDYFASEWGPGPKIEEGFEAICACDLKFVTGDVLPRLLLEGDRTEADVVIGLNSDVTKRARESGLFTPHGQDLSGLTMPVNWSDDIFLPFNWSQTAFVYDGTRLENPPGSFQELLDAPDDLKIVIQDPRSSISGLALLLWVKSVFGDESEDAWRKLRPKVLTVTPGWSESYGLFTDGEADMVLSYTTSPAYHIGAEQDASKRAIIFPEGHYFMVELAAQLKGTDQPELAQSFLDYVVSEDFQSMIAEANWSYPANLPRDMLPAYFAALPRPEKTLFLDEDAAEAARRPALDEWLSVFAE
ncbi:thiamine ABC transporter substrate-binding protein [Paracoccus aerodenitrificans]|uniref:thiamine ABC transporter substrate-binding protein n=1 Tax=Paracoccus aerodenitrificans TaxID=3017781 RepID=UPI0022F0A222|nr:thiamine ABC transporter substrate binding subunit [Paracoccus aerodenitrificans]WBU64554.1 thiamine ABC transporter substrate binding subunit [Paracoccus aerodenitrificans]